MLLPDPVTVALAASASATGQLKREGCVEKAPQLEQHFQTHHVDHNLNELPPHFHTCRSVVTKCKEPKCKLQQRYKTHIDRAVQIRGRVTGGAAASAGIPVLRIDLPETDVEGATHCRQSEAIITCRMLYVHTTRYLPFWFAAFALPPLSCFMMHCTSSARDPSLKTLLDALYSCPERTWQQPWSQPEYLEHHPAMS